MTTCMYFKIAAPSQGRSELFPHIQILAFAFSVVTDTGVVLELHCICQVKMVVKVTY